MSQFTDNRAQIINLRKSRDKKREQLQNTRISIRKNQEKLIEAKRQKNQNLIVSTEEQIKAIQQDHKQIERTIQGLQNDLIPLTEVITTPEQIKENFGELNSDFPVVLFPVRTEIRFKKIEQDVGFLHQLWVRIYPDDIAIDTHEEELTGDELAAGKTYWLENIKLSEDPRNKVEEFIGPWRTLARAYGPERAAWIVKETDSYEIQGTGEVSVEDVEFFYDRESKVDAWSKAPESRIMPDRFMVKLFKQGKDTVEKTGNRIPDPLITGPDPVNGVSEGDVEGDFTDSFGDVDGNLKVDPEMEWMVDFEKAVQNGMGIKISLSQQQYNEGFDNLLVLGFKLSSDENDARDRLENLIDTHHFSDEGISLIPNGTATNNTEDKTAGFSRFEQDEQLSFDTERKAPLISDDISTHFYNQKDGEILADALGIDRERFYHIQFSNNTDIIETSYMNRALWNATLGYFMAEMLDGVFTDQEIKHTRAFFDKYISGRGVIPSVRVGDQPYGMLPVTNYKNLFFPVERDFPLTHAAPMHISSYNREFHLYLNRLHNVLNKMENDWREMSGEVSFVGKTGDGYQHLLNILSLHASSVEYHDRFAPGVNYVVNLLNMKQLNAASVKLWEFILKKGLRVLESLGYKKEETIPPIFEKIFYKKAIKLSDVKNVIDRHTPSETDTIEEFTPGKNYIHWLAENEMDPIRKQDFGEGVEKPSALLYLMLRHSLMLHDAEAGHWLAIKQDIVRETYKDQEFLYIDDQSFNQGKFGQLIHPLSGITSPGQRLEDFLSVRANLTLHPETFSLKDHVEALDKLAELPTAKLERLFAETIDLCSYRLDAWKMGLVNYLMTVKRQVREEDEIQVQKGLYIGAYGWLQDLKPEKQDLKEIAPPLPEFEDDKPLFKDPDNGGHIFAPSLTHGVTAAVLRSSYLRNSDKDNPDTFKVNFSSERVRTALSYIEGINNGQSLESLLGYQFERGLHDRRSMENILDKFIYPLRKQFPLYSNRLTEVDTSESIEAIEARNVVNGYELIEHYREHKSDGFPFAIDAFSGANSAEQSALTTELERLRDAMDAVHDVVMSDSVYSAVQGNYDRAGGALDFIGEGKSVPFPEIRKTPRTGYALTHRVGIHFQAIPKNERFNAGLWNPIPSLAFTPRAQAEPAINKWLSEILPSPGDIFTHVAYKKSGTDNEVKVRFQDLSVQFIDLLYFIGTGAEGDMSELDARIASFVQTSEGLTADDEVAIQYMMKKESDTLAEVSFFELLPLLKSLRDIVISGRPLKTDDLMPASEGQELPDDFSQYDVDELEHRATQMKAFFDPIKTNFDAKLSELEANAGDVSLYPNVSGEIKPLMFEMNRFNVQRAFPDYPGNETDQVLKEQLLALAKTYSIRAEEMAEEFNMHYNSFTSATDEKSKVQSLTSAIQALLGTDFTVLPNVAVYNKTEFGNSHSQHTQVLSTYDDPFPMDTWMHGLARVRPKIESLENTIMMVENFGKKVSDLVPVQLPYLENDTWLGGKLPEDYVPDGDKMLYTAIYTHSFDAGEMQSGLMMDEWTEIIPTDMETAGLAFHFDQPNSEPPQTVLLAYSPVFNGNWKYEDLEESVVQAFEMAKLRAVDPDLIAKSKYSQLLPSIMVAVTRYLITASTNFAVNVNTQIVDTHG